MPQVLEQSLFLFFFLEKVWEVDIDVAAVGEAEALVLPSGERLPL